MDLSYASQIDNLMQSTRWKRYTIPVFDEDGLIEKDIAMKKIMQIKDSRYKDDEKEIKKLQELVGKFVAKDMVHNGQCVRILELLEMRELEIASLRLTVDSLRKKWRTECESYMKVVVDEIGTRDKECERLESSLAFLAVKHQDELAQKDDEIVQLKHRLAKRDERIIVLKGKRAATKQKYRELKAAMTQIV
jgi:hypothetical protein